MIDFNKLDPPDLTNADLDSLIESILCEMGQTIAPIDVELIAEKKGLNLIPISGLRFLSSTDAYLSVDKSEIAFDPDVANVRIRFSIAHELGHYYLHQALRSMLTQPELS